MEVGSLSVVMYCMGLLLVPAKWMMMNYLSQQITAVQYSSHMTPKHHEINDSVSELVALCKDVLRNRTKFPKPALKGWFTLVMSKVVCCLKQRGQRLQERSAMLLNKELDVVSMIKKQR